ncbi:MAG: LVIVD repeat-containing protein, partial [Candidatus Heimdallarchaeota archaeon]
MNMLNKKTLLTLWVLGLFSFTMIVVPPINGTQNNLNNSELSIKTFDIFVEDFDDTTYRDGATTSFGWRNGAVTNNRNFTWTQLDYYDTTYAVRDLDVQGRKLYCAVDTPSDNGLQLFDIRNLYDIKFTAARSTINSLISIAVDGDNAYVGANLSATPRLNSYNVSNAYDMTTGYLDTFYVDGLVNDIETEGHLVYFTSYLDDNNRSLRLAYAEDPDAMVEITPDWDNPNAHGLDINGQLAYIAASSEGFYILNMSDKYTPVELGHVNTPGNATEVIVDGAFAYVACGLDGVTVIDIRDPTSPAVVGHIDTLGFAQKLVLQGNTLFVADGGNGVVVLDVADPTHPTYVTSVNPAYAYSIDLFGGDLLIGAVDGIYAYRISATGGGIADISENWYQNVYDDHECWDVKVIGDIAYIAGGADGLITLNVRDPSNPILLDNHSIGVDPYYRGIDVQGGFAYITDYFNAFRIYDVRDPTNIKQTDFYGLTYPTDVAVAGDIAWIADGAFGVYYYNISDPYALSFMGSFDHGFDNITSIWVQ